MGLAGLALVGLGFWAVLRLPGILGLLVLMLALLAALALFLVPLFNRRGWRWLWLSVVTLALASAALLVLLNVPGTPLAGFKDVPYVGRLGQMLETEGGTGRVRVLIWEGVIDMLSPHEALDLSRWRQRHAEPRAHAHRLRPRNRCGWPTTASTCRNWAAWKRANASPDRSHNETFDSLVITGVLGFLAYILLFTGLFYHALRWLGLIQRDSQRNLFVALGVWAGWPGADPLGDRATAVRRAWACRWDSSWACSSTLPMPRFAAPTRRRCSTVAVC